MVIVDPRHHLCILIFNKVEKHCISLTCLIIWEIEKCLGALKNKLSFWKLVSQAHLGTLLICSRYRWAGVGARPWQGRYVRYMTPILLERWDLKDRRVEWMPPYILCTFQHPESSGLVGIVVKKDHTTTLLKTVPGLLVGSWCCVAAGPAVTASSVSSPLQERATPPSSLFQQLSGKHFLTFTVTSWTPSPYFLRTFHGCCSFAFPFTELFVSLSVSCVDAEGRSSGSSNASIFNLFILVHKIVLCLPHAYIDVSSDMHPALPWYANVMQIYMLGDISFFEEKHHHRQYCSPMIRLCSRISLQLLSGGLGSRRRMGQSL